MNKLIVVFHHGVITPESRKGKIGLGWATMGSRRIWKDGS
jgi:hypothetical protein